MAAIIVSEDLMPTWPATLPISTKSPSCRGSDFARSRKTCSPTIRTAIRAAPGPKAATRAAIRAAVCAADPCDADPRAAPQYAQLRHLRDLRHPRGHVCESDGGAAAYPGSPRVPVRGGIRIGEDCASTPGDLPRASRAGSVTTEPIPQKT